MCKCVGVGVCMCACLHLSVNLYACLYMCVYSCVGVWVCAYMLIYVVCIYRCREVCEVNDGVVCSMSWGCVLYAMTVCVEQYVMGLCLVCHDSMCGAVCHGAVSCMS